MLIKGKKIEGLNIEEIFIPRGDDVLHFRARAVADYSYFEAVCPRPKPKKGRNRNNEMVELIDAPAFQIALDEYAQRRVAYMVIKSLEATEDLEWETVKISDVNTWLNWRKEFEDAGFTEAEIVRIVNGVMSACGLDESKVEKARARFLAGRQVESETQSSQKDEPNSTRSGELVQESE